jgi:uncharacterized membrane protein
MNMLCKCGRGVVSSLVARRLIVPMLALVALVAFSSSAWATDPITLPDTGVDLEGLIGALLTSLGVAVTVIVGGFFAFKLIKVAMRWVGTIGG